MKCDIDTAQMCSHLQHKLFDDDGEYHQLWQAIQAHGEVTYVVRSRQLHVYCQGKKILILAGKSAPKILRNIDFLNQ